MPGIFACILTSVGWCFCTAAGSLCTSCCGNDKPGSVPPGPHSGRKRSVLLLFLSILFQLAFQFGLARYFVSSSLSEKSIDASSIESLSSSALQKFVEQNNFVTQGWINGCIDDNELVLLEANNVDTNSTEYIIQETLLYNCVGTVGNYRVSFITVIFFILFAVAAALQSTANRVAWPAKYMLYTLFVVASIFIPNEPVFTSSAFVWIGRIGGAVFIIVQQFVLLDCATNWNDSWVDRSNKAEAEKTGSGKNWLVAIIVSCGLLFAVALVMLIYMFIAFTGCTTNNIFISFTLILCIVITWAQMSGEEGSLLSSASISAWATFLCYTAVIKNPSPTCNPRLGQLSSIEIIFGVAVTILSLLWAGWSYTAEDKLRIRNNTDTVDLEQPTAEATKEPEKITGIVAGATTSDYGTTGDDTTSIKKKTNGNNDNDDDETEENLDPSQLSNSWRLNIALATVSCWCSMILTHWGDVSAGFTTETVQMTDNTIASHQIGKISMWMIIGTQWFILILYLWALLAPRLFPDRDFN